MPPETSAGVRLCAIAINRRPATFNRQNFSKPNLAYPNLKEVEMKTSKKVPTTVCLFFMLLLLCSLSQVANADDDRDDREGYASVRKFCLQPEGDTGYIKIVATKQGGGFYINGKMIDGSSGFVDSLIVGTMQRVDRQLIIQFTNYRENPPDPDAGVPGDFVTNIGNIILDRRTLNGSLQGMSISVNPAADPGDITDQRQISTFGFPVYRISCPK